jgi:Family of unknown function (DUF6134)
MVGMKQRLSCHVLLSASGWLLLVVGGLLFPGMGRAGAADVETRDFTILVDGKASGNYHMSIKRHEDGAVSLAAESEVHVSVLLVPVYSYSYHGQEVWKDGRLQHFESSGKENNKPFAVTAEATANGLRVKVNGQEHTALPEVWTTSYWRLPGAEHRNKAILLMGCDNGQEKVGSLHHVGVERMKIAGQELPCAHYRVMRDVAYEVWYDGEDRLVREEWVSNGHRTVLELMHVGH